MSALGALWYSQQPGDIASAMANGHYQIAAKRLQQERLQSTEVNPLVSTTLANLYHLGLGVSRDLHRSAELYSEAAFAGSLSAQVNLGNLYANGQGVEEDSKLAYAWFNFARNNGSKIAQSYMSELLAQHKIYHLLVLEIRSEYVNLNNFPKLH